MLNIADIRDILRLIIVCITFAQYCIKSLTEETVYIKPNDSELKVESHVIFDEADLNKELLCTSNLHDRLTRKCKKMEN